MTTERELGEIIGKLDAIVTRLDGVEKWCKSLDERMAEAIAFGHQERYKQAERLARLETKMETAVSYKQVLWWVGGAIALVPASITVYHILVG